MNNKFILKLVDDDIEKSVNKTGVAIRKVLNPLMQRLLPLHTYTKIRVTSRAKMPKGQPIIFACTHGFYDDAALGMVTTNKPFYVLFGSLPLAIGSLDGIFAWMLGAIFIDRTDKVSRRAAKDKMVRALQLGTNVLIYPEGVWNVHPCKMMSGLYPGVYDVAVESGALVAPIACLRNGNASFSVLGEAFDISQYDRKEGLEVLRDKMATLRYDLMETYAQDKRDTFPHGREALKEYWDQYIDSLIKEVGLYDRETEERVTWRDPGVIEPEEAFAHLSNLPVKRETAFLFNKRLA